MIKSVQYFARALHRVLGYLAVGMVMIYALSGIVLINRTGDFMKKEVNVDMMIAPDLDADQLAKSLNLRNFELVAENDEIIAFGQRGLYNRQTGHVTYIKKEFVAPFNKFNELHKLSMAKNKHIAAATTVFGIVLFLLALTGLFMYRPSAKPFKTNMLYTLIGIIVAIILLLSL